METRLDANSVKDLFAEALRASFEDLDIPDRGVLDYLADLLARYSRASELTPLDRTGQPMVTLGDRVREIRRAWDPDGGGFDPGREVEIRRGMADYTLFMSGFFWERVRDASMSRHYAREGRRAYRFVGEYHRARREERAAAVAFTLATRFETCAAVLSYMRDVHLGAEFAPWPHRVFARIID